MRKLFPLMLVGSICMAFAACKRHQKEEEGPVKGLKKMQEPKTVVDATPQTYFITAPHGWTQKDTIIAGVRHTEMYSPKDGPGDHFKENINVNSQSALGYDFKTYAEANLAGIRQKMPGVEITDLGETTLNDLNAECYIYTIKYLDLDLKDIAWYTVKNDIGYVITCTALQSTFGSFEPTFKLCANTFMVK